MLKSLFRPRPSRAAGEALYASAAAQARNPQFYRDYGVPDQMEARFELYTLHVALLLEALRDRGEATDETAQALLDAYVRALDELLRDVGVGDLSMAKKMKKLAGVVMGRIESVRDAAADETGAALSEYIGRTALDGVEADARPIAAYALRALSGLRSAPDADLIRGKAAWPEIAG